MKITKGIIDYTVTDGYEWFWNQFANGSWEPDTFKVFDTFLDADRNFLDVGAWIGPTALYASRKANRVYAFEPDPVAYTELTENIRLNMAANVITYPVAVSSDWKNIGFGTKVNFGDSMSSELWGQGNYNTVPALPLSSLVIGVNPNLIKIDIEGGEKFLFQDKHLASLLKQFKPTIHLSLHTPWFKTIIELESYKKSIIDGLEMYPYFYNEKLESVELGDMFNPYGFNSIVASFIKLK